MAIENSKGSGTTTEDRYVGAAEALWESARGYMRDGWRGRPDEWVAEVKAMRAEVRRVALEDAKKAVQDVWNSMPGDDLGDPSYAIDALLDLVSK